LCGRDDALSLAALVMIYPFSLGPAMLVVGLLLVAAHGWALLRPQETQAWLRAFPRSRFLGIALLVIATVWAWFLILNIDLGEFSDWRPRLLLFIPIAAFLTAKYVDEFLAVRALGMLGLLAAEPLLEAAWLRPEWARLFLVVLAYVWVLLGMFWIGMPYLMRDQIAWLTKEEGRWRAAAFAGLGYGALLLILPLILHRSA
jgi:hypothetical protein